MRRVVRNSNLGRKEKNYFFLDIILYFFVKYMIFLSNSSLTFI